MFFGVNKMSKMKSAQIINVFWYEQFLARHSLSFMGKISMFNRTDDKCKLKKKGWKVKHLNLNIMILGNTSWRSGQDLGKLYDNVTPNPTG